jgi:protein TonB
MKKLLTSLFLFISLISFAQEITYYNEDGEKVGKEEPYYRSEITVPDSSNKKQVIVKRYRPDGSLVTWDTYKNKNKKVRNGLSLQFDSLGRTEYEATHMEGKLDGYLKTFWPNGVLKRWDRYDLDEFQGGSCFDAEGKEVAYYKFLEPAFFIGGQKALSFYLGSNLVYPESLIMRKTIVTGRVLISFVIEADGNITNAKIVKGIHPDCDLEAMRVVINMPRWVPAILEGKAIRSRYTQPITFLTR